MVSIAYEMNGKDEFQKACKKYSEAYAHLKGVQEDCVFKEDQFGEMFVKKLGEIEEDELKAWLSNFEAFEVLVEKVFKTVKENLIYSFNDTGNCIF